MVIACKVNEQHSTRNLQGATKKYPGDPEDAGMLFTVTVRLVILGADAVPVFIEEPPLPDFISVVIE